MDNKIYNNKIEEVYDLPSTIDINNVEFFFILNNNLYIKNMDKEKNIIVDLENQKTIYSNFEDYTQISPDYVAIKKDKTFNRGVNIIISSSQSFTRSRGCSKKSGWGRKFRRQLELDTAEGAQNRNQDAWTEPEHFRRPIPLGLQGSRHGLLRGARISVRRRHPRHRLECDGPLPPPLRKSV